MPSMVFGVFLRAIYTFKTLNCTVAYGLWGDFWHLGGGHGPLPPPPKSAYGTTLYLIANSGIRRVLDNILVNLNSGLRPNFSRFNRLICNPWSQRNCKRLIQMYVMRARVKYLHVVVASVIEHAGLGNSEKQAFAVA